MKIEELYPQNEADKKEKKTVEKPAATSVAKNVSASSEEKKSKDPCKIKSKRVASSKRKRQQSGWTANYMENWQLVNFTSPLHF